jgi:hypothetical protein
VMLPKQALESPSCLWLALCLHVLG